LLEVKPFDDGFDDDVGLCQLGEVVGEADAIERRLRGSAASRPFCTCASSILAI
jgi:hypothetical protein